MKRQVDYIWRVPELMATAGMHNSIHWSRASPSVVSSCRARRSTAWFINAPNGFRYR